MTWKLQNGWRWVLLVAASAAAGCGGDGLELAPVEGIVTLDGQPVANAGVLFAPVSAEQGPPASGATDEQGRFRLMTNNREGASLGEHRVTISKADPFGEQISLEELESVKSARYHGFMVYQTKHELPPRYADIRTSELTAKVEEKDNVIDFNLTAK